MQLNKMADIYADVFNLLIGTSKGTQPIDISKLVARREDILKKLKVLMVEDYDKKGARNVSDELLPIKITGKNVLQAIGGYYGKD